MPQSKEVIQCCVAEFSASVRAPFHHRTSTMPSLSFTDLPNTSWEIPITPPRLLFEVLATFHNEHKNCLISSLSSMLNSSFKVRLKRCYDVKCSYIHYSCCVVYRDTYLSSTHCKAHSLAETAHDTGGMFQFGRKTKRSLCQPKMSFSL